MVSDSIAFVSDQYHFCTGSVLLLYWVRTTFYRVSIAVVLCQCCFCIPWQCHLLLAFVPVNTTSCLVCVFALLQFSDWYTSGFGIRCLLFWNNRTSPFYLKSLCNGNIIKRKCVQWEITERNCTYTKVNSIMIYWHWFTIQNINSGTTLSVKPI